MTPEKERERLMQELDRAASEDRRRALDEAASLPATPTEERLAEWMKSQVTPSRPMWRRHALVAAAVVLAVGGTWLARHSIGVSEGIPGGILLSTEDFALLEVRPTETGEYVLRFALREPLPGGARYVVRVTDVASGLELDREDLGERTEWTLSEDCYGPVNRKVALRVEARALGARAQVDATIEVELPGR